MYNKEMLSIAHIIKDLKPESGGPTTTTLALTRAIRDIGVKCNILTGEECSQTGIKIDKAIRWGRISTKIQREYNVFHIHGLWNTTVSLSIRQIRLLHLPYMLTLHGMLRPETIWYLRKKVWACLWEKANVAGASVIRVTSEDEYNSVKECGWLLPPIALIPNPVRCVTPKEIIGCSQVKDHYNPTILFIGRISRIKRLPLLIEAFALVQKQIPDCVLQIAGPDYDGIQHELQKLAMTFDLNGAVKFLGMKTQQELAHLISASDVSALVSERENFGMAVAEAMSYGVPAVLTRHVGIAYEAEQAGAAIVADDNADSIAQALLKILHNDVLKHAMGAAGEELVRTKYSPRAVASQTVDVCRWILAQGPKPDCVRLD